MNGLDGQDPRRRSIGLSTVLIGALILVIVTSGVTYGLVTHFLMRSQDMQDTFEELQEAENFERFLQVLMLARTWHVDEPDIETLLEGAMSGALESTGDPYSVYFDASEYQSFQIDSEGEYEGIGTLVVEKKVGDKTYVTVVTPFPGTPAATTPFEGAGPDDPVGLKPNDRLISVDGHNVVGTPLELAAEMMRGKAGSTVKVEIERDGYEDTLVFNIERAKIEVPTTESRMLKDNIGYILITSFSEKTPGQVAEAINELRALGMQGLVLDLRNNPGGRLDSVEGVAEYFVPQGTLVHILSRKEGEQQLTVEEGGPVVPFVLLVNGGSASASEILAGAVKDYGVAPIVGTRTFGKGSVQSIWSLEEGTGVKITTAEYVTPERNKINGVGLEPDIRLELDPNAEFGTLEGPNPDNQLQRAVMELESNL